MRDNAEGPVSQEAASWLARKDRGLTAAEEVAFARWQAADPRHATEFARLTSAWDGFGLAKAEADLVEMARKLDHRTRAGPLRRRRGVWRWALAATAAAIMVAVGVWRGREPAAAGSGSALASYHIVPGAAKRLVLDDGSVAELRGDSEIWVEFTAAERRVKLIRGEVFFTVAKNRARPFIVGAGQITVRAVGTAFTVQIDPSQVGVMVTEGEVGLGGTQLRAGSGAVKADAPEMDPIVFAGQRAVVASGPGASIAPGPVKVASLTPSEMDEVLSWRNTWLVFNRTPLAKALAAFNRHGSQQLILSDPSLQGRRLSGSSRRRCTCRPNAWTGIRLFLCRPGDFSPLNIFVTEIRAYRVHVG